MHRHRGVGILYLDSLDNVMGSYQNGRLGVKISTYRRYLKDMIYKYKKIGQIIDFSNMDNRLSK